jgi:hypothetical protein
MNQAEHHPQRSTEVTKFKLAAVITVTAGVAIWGWQLVSGESDPCNDGRMKGYFGDEHHSSRRVSPGVWVCVNKFGSATQVEVMSDGAVYYRHIP